MKHAQKKRSQQSKELFFTAVNLAEMHFLALMPWRQMVHNMFAHTSVPALHITISKQRPCSCHSLSLKHAVLCCFKLVADLFTWQFFSLKNWLTWESPIWGASSCKKARSRPSKVKLRSPLWWNCNNMLADWTRFWIWMLKNTACKRQLRIFWEHKSIQKIVAQFRRARISQKIATSTSDGAPQNDSIEEESAHWICDKTNHVSQILHSLPHSIAVLYDTSDCLVWLNFLLLHDII